MTSPPFLCCTFHLYLTFLASFLYLGVPVKPNVIFIAAQTSVLLWCR